MEHKEIGKFGERKPKTTVLGSFQGSMGRPFDVVILLIEDRRGQAKKLVSNSFRLKEYNEAFESKGIKNIFTIGC